MYVILNMRLKSSVFNSGAIFPVVVDVLKMMKTTRLDLKLDSLSGFSLTHF